jgi:hypothetical protein
MPSSMLNPCEPAVRVSDLRDPNLRELGNRIFKMTRVASEKAVAHYKDSKKYPISDDQKSLEQIFLNRLKSLPQLSRELAVKKVMSVVDERPAVRARYYRELSHFDLRSETSIDDQIRNIHLTAGLNLSKYRYATKIQAAEPGLFSFDGILGPQLSPETFALMEIDTEAQEVTNKLEFRIHKVKCVDETDGFLGSESGDDEIYLGGNATDTTGVTKQLTTFMVRDDFDDGEYKIYTPPKVLVDFDLSRGVGWPRSYFVMLVLVEKDNGGISDFMNDMLDTVKRRVASAIAQEIGVAVAALAGPIIGAVIIAVSYLIVGAIVDLIIEAWQDDVFRPFAQDIVVPSYNLRWAGNTESPQGFARFRGHGGAYNVRYSWRIHA